MFRTAPDDDVSDARRDEILREVSREVFGPDDEVKNLDFATIERRSHEVGRRVARRLLEEAAARQAEDACESRPCPDCRRPCRGTVETRELISQDGPIQLQEAAYSGPRCRRAFFPQPSPPATPSSPLQPGDLDQGRLDSRRGQVVSRSVETAPNQHRLEHLGQASSGPRARSATNSRRSGVGRPRPSGPGP